MARLNSLTLLANAKYNELSEMYGDDPNKWRTAGAATLIGADIAEGYNEWANASLQANALERRQQEVSRRADVSIANLLQQGEQVAASQATAFVKSGVKLEGSALNVMSETMEQANSAARVRRMEADFEISQMKVQEAMMRTKAKFAPFQTALNIASSAVSSGIFNQPSQGTPAQQQALKTQLGSALDDFRSI